MLEIELLMLERDFFVVVIKPNDEASQLIQTVHLKTTHKQMSKIFLQLSCGSVHSRYQTSSEPKCDSLGLFQSEFSKIQSSW